MKQELKDFFKSLVETPGCSGFEQAVQNVVRNFVQPYCQNITTDVHGNVMAHKVGTGNVRLMLAGHADEIGLMVKYIDENGFLYFDAIGGIDFTILPGLRVNLINGKEMIRGVIGKKPIHLLKTDERDKGAKREDLFIDIGAKNKEEAEKKVSIGNFATFSPGLEYLTDDIVVTKATDNKAGVLVAMGVLHELQNEQIEAHVYAVSTVQEEIGIRGARTSAFNIDPHVGIAIDVTHATDYPTVNKTSHGDCKLGKGAVISVGANINPVVYEMLKNAARTANVSFQIEAAPGATGTDANFIQINKSGVAAALVSIPNRYMHTPNEVICISDLEAAIKIIAQFARDLKDSTSLIPV